MHSFEFLEEKPLENIELLKKWMRSFQYPIDSYLEEEYILHKDSKFFIITDDQKLKFGFFTVKNEETISSFYVLPEFQLKFDPKDIFNEILRKKSKINQAHLSTIDLFFFNSVLDHQKMIKVMGYSPFVLLRTKPIDLNYQGIDFDEMKLASEKNKKEIEEVLKGNKYFMTKEEISIYLSKKTLYLFKEKGKNEILAIGVICSSEIDEKTKSIGMFVNKNYRRKGIGTYVLKSLQNYCLKDGFNVASGCDSTNIPSRKTLIKSGQINRGSFIVVNF